MARISRGTIKKVSGPVVVGFGIDVKMSDIVYVGNEKLMGEVIKIGKDDFTIQVYEETHGVKPGEPINNTNMPLSVELGPGLLGSIYDGIQRPLQSLEKEVGSFLKRGIRADGLDKEKKWKFTMSVKNSQKVEEGEVLGYVEEFDFKHKILVPNGIRGRVKDLKNGEYTTQDKLCMIDKEEISLSFFSAVRNPRLFKEKLAPSEPLKTGQRVYDVFFPVAKGGVAALPGPFGAGKTVTQQSIAKWSDADIVVYVGCGERGNEMTDVLSEFPHLIDPKSGKPMMNRTVLIANTSNMPVAAREASVYVGMTIAEYYRDMGYNVALMADSTSRWAEAMREISSRLEEMPGEEGYPAYLSNKISSFYERAGVVKTKNNEIGSISVIGAVSPAGGDFSEPVTQNTLRVAKCFWALDAKLAEKRHYWSINWLNSYSLYHKTLEDYFKKNIDKEWKNKVDKLMTILQEEDKLNEIVQLVGSDSLPDSEQVILEVARLIREELLQQNAFHEVDRYCPLNKANDLIELVLLFDELSQKAVSNKVPAKEIIDSKTKYKFSEVKLSKNHKKLFEEVRNELKIEFDKLIKKFK